ncbi:hypothetical protein Tco_0592673 [Tanacetum coccineum]
MLPMQAQENGVVLDEEQLLFLAGGHDNAIDEDVDEQPVQDLALNVDNVFQADDCYATDSQPLCRPFILRDLGNEVSSRLLGSIEELSSDQRSIIANKDELREKCRSNSVSGLVQNAPFLLSMTTSIRNVVRELDSLFIGWKKGTLELEQAFAGLIFERIHSVNALT